MKDSSETTTEKKLTTDQLAAAARGREHGTDDIAHPAQDRDPEGRASESAARDSELSPLFSNDEERDFRNRWKDIQTGFVDEPRKSVEQADELIAKLLQRLAESFSEQRSHLEQQWEKSDSASTEDLRLALRRYRSFFDRLLSI
jgi:inorganic triphosphatase YgiF